MRVCVVLLSRLRSALQCFQDWQFDRVEQRLIGCEIFSIERRSNVIWAWEMRAMRKQNFYFFDHRREEWESSLKLIFAFFNTCKNNFMPFLCLSCKKGMFGMLMRKGISEMVKKSTLFLLSKCCWVQIESYWTMAVFISHFFLQFSFHVCRSILLSFRVKEPKWMRRGQ